MALPNTPMTIGRMLTGVKWDMERTGLGFRSEGRIEAKDTAQPTTCKMQRPG